MLRKTIHRPNHRERAQPAERERWGVLEKHKDYSLRARDFQEKKKRLQLLRQKASERNPDEFHYGMLSSKSKNGRKMVDRDTSALSQDAVKLLKTQDSGYLRTMLQKTRRAIEKLEEEFVLHEEEGAKVNRENQSEKERQHLVFVGTKEEQKQYTPGLVKSTSPNQETSTKRAFSNGAASRADPPRKHESLLFHASKPLKAIKRETDALKQDMLLRKQHRKERDARKSRLAALKSREKDLMDAENELELQRAKMSNSVGGVTKAGKTWRVRERKK